MNDDEEPTEVQEGGGEEEPNPAETLRAMTEAMKVLFQTVAASVKDIQAAANPSIPKPVTTGGIDAVPKDLFGELSETRRSEAEMLQVGRSADNAAFDLLDPIPKAKWVANARKGTQRKFRAPGQLNYLEQVNSVNHLTQLMECWDSLVELIGGINARKVFLVFQCDKDGHALDPKESPPKDLLDLSQDVMEAEIAESTKEVMSRASEETIQKMRWAFDIVMNSCDDPLKQILKTLMGQYRASIEKWQYLERSAPMLLYHLKNQVYNADPASLRLVNDHLANLRLPEDGDVTVASKSFAVLYNHLHKYKAEPSDPSYLYFKVILQSPNAMFVQYVRSYIENYRLNHAQAYPPFVKLMEYATAKYTELRILEPDLENTHTHGGMFHLDTDIRNFRTESAPGSFAMEASRRQMNNRREPQGNQGGRNDYSPALPHEHNRRIMAQGGAYIYCSNCPRWHPEGSEEAHTSEFCPRAQANGRQGRGAGGRSGRGGFTNRRFYRGRGGRAGRAAGQGTEGREQNRQAAQRTTMALTPNAAAHGRQGRGGRGGRGGIRSGAAYSVYSGPIGL